jgi:hypothetical protein
VFDLRFDRRRKISKARLNILEAKRLQVVADGGDCQQKEEARFERH